MNTRIAKIVYCPAKHCFVNIPRSWSAQFDNGVDGVSVLELQYGDNKTAYVSVSAGGVSPSQAGTDIIQMSGLYGNKLGISHEQEVMVTMLPSVPTCSKLFVEPVSVDDWEILEMHAGYLENNLLNQIRVVWPKQIMPAWVNKNICIFVSIEKMDPDCKCCILDQFTEVIVAPKTRSSPLPSLQRQPVSPKSSHHSSKKQITNSNKSNSDVHNMHTSDHMNSPSADESALAARAEDIKDNDVVNKFMNYMRAWWSYLRSSPLAQDREERVDHNEFCDFPMNWCLRVQPIPDLDELIELSSVKPQERNTTNGKPGLPKPNYFLQPSCVYVKEESLIGALSAFDSQELPATFLASVTRIPSPSEREAKFQRKMEQAKAKAKAEKIKSKLNQTSLPKGDNDTIDKFTESSEEQYESSSVVRVVVLSDTDHILAVPSSQRLKSVNMCNGAPVVMNEHVGVSSEMRRQLGLEQTGKVILKTLNHQHVTISAISLYPLFPMPPGFSKDMLHTAVKTWLDSTCSIHHPYVITNGSLLRCLLKKDMYGEFLIIVESKSQDNSSYHLLYPELFDTLDVVIGDHITADNKPDSISNVPHHSVQDIDPPLPVPGLNQMGGIGTYAEQCLHHLELSICQKTLSKHVFSNSPGLEVGALLLTGSKGCGKSSLGRALCRKLASPPNLAYVVVVECKTLRGKRVDTVYKHLDKIFCEAAWRQPSVILLDDLDHIATEPQGPEQEMSGEALHHGRTAEAIKDILKKEIMEKSRVAVIATSSSRASLHKSLVSSRGVHLFQKFVNISPPNQKEREDLLKAILTTKTSVSTECFSSLNTQQVAAKTEGYVARDLDALVNRAIHAHFMAGSSESTKSLAEIHLTDENFVSALSGFKPVSLQNVPLHTAGDVGWSDIGGLWEVRKTLVETLMWPSKYPVLFANCPLRLRSGLLLYGAPGTGKTLLAGAVAKECGLNFISIKGPELLSKYIGASEQAVRDTFARARSAKPCILFFDEFDSLAPKRGHDSTGVTDRVVNQLLTQLDGVEGLEGVYVLGATSRPDLIDPALLRPGRLDKCLHCPLPNKEERLEILQVMAKKMNLADDVDMNVLAEACKDFTGADFKALLYNAQLQAIHQTTSSYLEKENFQKESLDQVLSNQMDDDIKISDMSIDGSTSQVIAHSSGFEKQHETSQNNTDVNKMMIDEFSEKPFTDPKPHNNAKEDSNVAILNRKVEEVNFVYMPTLEEGVKELNSDATSAIQNKLEIITSNLHNHQKMESSRSNSDQKKAESMVPKVYQHYLLAALRETNPSVSPKERLKYQQIFEHFQASRGEGFGHIQSGSRVTLA